MPQFYYLETDHDELVCGETPEIAKEMLHKMLGIPTNITVVAEKNTEYDNARNYSVTLKNTVIGVYEANQLYIENWNISDEYDHKKDVENFGSSGRIFLIISEDERDLINKEIWAGKSIIKDGRRAKSLTNNMKIKYSAGLTFWWDNDVLWACLPSDEEAIMWMLRQ